MDSLNINRSNQRQNNENLINYQETDNRYGMNTQEVRELASQITQLANQVANLEWKRNKTIQMPDEKFQIIKKFSLENIKSIAESLKIQAQPLEYYLLKFPEGIDLSWTVKCIATALEIKKHHPEISEIFKQEGKEYKLESLATKRSKSPEDTVNACIQEISEAVRTNNNGKLEYVADFFHTLFQTWKEETKDTLFEHDIEKAIGLKDNAISPSSIKVIFIKFFDLNKGLDDAFQAAKNQLSLGVDLQSAEDTLDEFKHCEKYQDYKEQLSKEAEKKESQSSQMMAKKKKKKKKSTNSPQKETVSTAKNDSKDLEEAKTPKIAFSSPTNEKVEKSSPTNEKAGKSVKKKAKKTMGIDSLTVFERNVKQQQAKRKEKKQEGYEERKSPSMQSNASFSSSFISTPSISPTIDEQRFDEKLFELIDEKRDEFSASLEEAISQSSSLDEESLFPLYTKKTIQEDKEVIGFLQNKLLDDGEAEFQELSRDIDNAVEALGREVLFDQWNQGFREQIAKW